MLNRINEPGGEVVHLNWDVRKSRGDFPEVYFEEM